MMIEELETKLDKSNIDSDTLIELTRYLKKYQKIEEIISRWNYHCISTQVAISEIANEVLEDGNIN